MNNKQCQNTDTVEKHYTSASVSILVKKAEREPTMNEWMKVKVQMWWWR